MKKVITVLLSLVLSVSLVLSCVGCGNNETEEIQQGNAARALRLFEQIYEDYYEPEALLAHWHYPYTEENDKIAGDWHVVALLQAAILLRDLYPENEFVKEAERSLYQAMDYFRQARPDGYLVYATERGLQPGMAPMKTAFDDNVHIARVYMEGYQITGDETYLEKAKELIRFVLTEAWHDEINTATGEPIGGLGWGEGSNWWGLFSCTNGPGAAMCLEMYDLVESQEEKQYYLDWAIKIYDWLVDYQRAPNGLYWDGSGSFAMEDGSTSTAVGEGTFHTYNSGFPITDGVRLYQITGEEKYLNDARFTASAAFDYFADGSIKEGYYQYSQTYDEAGNWFNQILFEGFLALAEEDASAEKYVDSFADGLNYAYDNYYRNGYIPTNYISGWLPYSVDDEQMQILSVSANVVMFARLAIAERDAAEN